MLGDIADADMRPPENALFVCKLNPVTEDEDLEIIFSRFGECKCDIIRDYKTGDSLNYAFVEFEQIDSATQAYFKMDGALVDDRRRTLTLTLTLALALALTLALPPRLGQHAHVGHVRERRAWLGLGLGSGPNPNPNWP